MENSNEITLHAIEKAPGQYQASMTIRAIAHMVDCGAINGLQPIIDAKTNSAEYRGVRRITTAICNDEYYFDEIRFAVLRGTGATVSYEDGALRIAGSVSVVDGAYQIIACCRVAVTRDDLLDRRFGVTFYVLDNAGFGRAMAQFAITSKKKPKALMPWKRHPACDIVAAVNKNPAADCLYAGKISDEPDAVIYSYALVDCITEYFPVEYMEDNRRGELVEYLVQFLNIAVSIFGDDYADPASSLAAGRFITTEYGTYLLCILASCTLPIYKNNKEQWMIVVRNALANIDVCNEQLSKPPLNHRVNAKIIKSDLMDRVKSVMSVDQSDCATEYYDICANDTSVGESRRNTRRTMIRGMLAAITAAESDIGISFASGDNAAVAKIIGEVMKKYSRNYAYIVGVELRKYMNWLTTNKGVVFNEIAYAPFSTKKSSDNKIENSYFASMDDLRKWIDKLIPLREFPTQRDYDRLIIQLVYLGFKADEAVSIPVSAMNGNVIFAYDKRVVVDDSLREQIAKYRTYDVRRADDDIGTRTYEIDRSLSLVQLNSSVPDKSTAGAFRKRIRQYCPDGSEKRFESDAIWRSGKFRRMIDAGTTIDLVTGGTIGKDEESDFRSFKRLYTE